MASLLSSLRNQIFEEENSPTPPKAKPAAFQPATQTVPVVSSGMVASFPVNSQFNQVNSEIKVQLDKAIAEANQLSYTEFFNYLDAMSSALVGTDEATRYRAALAAATKKGFAPQEIVRGIDAILQVLQNEERNFHEDASRRIAERVGVRETEVVDIDQQIISNNNKIVDLQSQNSQLNTRKRTASDEIRIEHQKVEDKKKAFSSTVSAEKTRYQEERNKVLTYSGNGKGA